MASAHPHLRPPSPRSQLSFLSTAFSLTPSVLPRILPTVLALTFYSGLICLADLIYDARWTTSYSITSSLSVVVGLLLVFRNSTSYDRWWEGRKLWGDLTATVRNLGVMIWVNVETEAEEGKRETRRERKRRAVTLLAGLMVGVKHELRGEEGTHWADYRGVLPKEWLSTAERSSSRSDGGLNGGDLEQQAIAGTSERSPLLTSLPSDHHYDEQAHPLPITFRIITELHSYLSSAHRSGHLQALGAPGFSLLLTQLSSLSTITSSLLRISSTPIPPIYSTHLKQSVLIYLLVLPPALVGQLGWKVVPFQFVIGAMLVGLEGISVEIEHPFGGDECDLGLDEWCEGVRGELEVLMREVEGGLRDE